MRVPKEKLALDTIECKAGYLAEQRENDGGRVEGFIGADKKVTPPHHGTTSVVGIPTKCVWLCDSYRLRLWTFRSGADLEDDLLTLFENLVATHIDRGIVDEDILSPTVNGNETVALFSVEPLHGSVRHCVLPAVFWWLPQGQPFPDRSRALRPATEQIGSSKEH